MTALIPSFSEWLWARLARAVSRHYKAALVPVSVLADLDRNRDALSDFMDCSGFLRDRARRGAGRHAERKIRRRSRLLSHAIDQATAPGPWDRVNLFSRPLRSSGGARV